MNSNPSFREDLRRMQQRHPLFQSAHPFWMECFRGRLAVEDLRRWALDVYPIVRDFARFYLHVATKCESEQAMTFLAETIFEETGSGVEAESHPTLFRGFLAALGAGESDIPAVCTTAGGRAFHEFCRETVQAGSFVEGLTLVGIGIERPLPTFFEMIGRALRRHYGMDAEAVKYFNVHTVADVKHSQLASRIVAEQARHPAEQARVREIAMRVWDLQQAQLDELYRALGRGRRRELYGSS